MKINVPKPASGAAAADKFEELVRKCEAEGCINPIMSAAARDPKLYRDYRESFVQRAETPTARPPAPNADVREYDRVMFATPPEKRAARISKLASEQPAIYNAARAAGRI